jgi:hypothetical protein
LLGFIAELKFCPPLLNEFTFEFAGNKFGDVGVFTNVKLSPKSTEIGDAEELFNVN